MADEQTWDAAHYDESASFVSEYGADLVDLLDPAPGERILDLGCGTGHLAARIAESGATVVGADRSPEMVGAAREAYSDLAFLRADARALPFDGAFDAVFSNAALHWVRDPDAAVASIHDALVPGGRLVLEMGGAGNVAAITDAVAAELAARGYDPDHPWYFPTVGEYASRLEAAGFEVRFARLFDRPTDLDGGDDGLRDWLAAFGDRWLGRLPESERRAVVAAVEDRLRGDLYRDGTWVADYRRLRVVAVRE